ncbi:hypothetical protein GCM10025734_11510 [Kitasatospora paranensis]
MLRASEARDRAAFIELFASPEVGTYVGGARPRDELERTMSEVPGRRPGVFVLELDGAMIGVITLDPRAAERPGHVRPEAGETELGYLFLPEAWGRGYATEACTAALDWFAAALPGEPVVLSTQTANAGSMRVAAKLGFTEADRFEEYGAEQWFGVRSSATPSDGDTVDAVDGVDGVAELDGTGATGATAAGSAEAVAAGPGTDGISGRISSASPPSARPSPGVRPPR